MHAIERELIKVTGYKARTKFSDRQDYLSSILNAVSKLDDDDFDNLSDEAAEWANAAVEAKNSKESEIPDFDEVGAAAEETSEGASDDDADSEADEEGEDGGDDDEADDASDDDTDPDDDDDDSEADEADDEEDDSSDDNPESDDDEDEDEPEEKPVKKPVSKKAAKPDPAPKLKPPPKPKPKAPKVHKPRPVEEDVVLDKWGCMEGSKNSQALSLFEKGATAKEVKDKLGGTYYNIMKKMVADGHTIEKDGAVITIIHKDAKKPAKAVKKAKK